MGINDGSGEEKEDDEGRKKDNSYHDSYHFQKVCLLVYLPDIVENPPDADHHPDDYPDKCQHAYEAEESGVGRVQDIGRGVHEDVYEVLVVDVGDKEPFKFVGDSEIVSKEKTYREQRYYRHCALVAQSGGLEADLLGGECAEHRDHRLDVTHQDGLPAGQVVVVDVPDVIGDEL